MIFDGKPHALSEDYGYIIKTIEENISFNHSEAIKNEILREYVLYKMKNDPHYCVDVLMKHFMFEDGGCGDNFSFIYRPPYMVNVLSQYGTMSIKFKRIKDDNLKD